MTAITDRMTGLIRHQQEVTSQQAGASHIAADAARGMKDVTDSIRDNVADFEDFWRPIRSYFYWEKHCYDIPICWSLRSIFDTLDGIDELSDKTDDLVKDLDQLDALLPQLLEQFPPLIATAEDARKMILTMHSTMSGVLNGMDESSDNATAMGQAFDASKNDDTFYLPPEVFQNADFQRAMTSFLSPDGKAARFIISHKGDPATPEGIAR